MYRTALMILLRIGTPRPARCWPGCRCSAVRLALLEWFRAAELSADRAATLVNRDPLVTCRTLMVMAGGAASRKLNLDAFIKQAARVRGVGAAGTSSAGCASSWRRRTRTRSGACASS